MKKRSSRHIERYILELNDISQPFYIKSTYYIDSHVDTFNSKNGLPVFILFKFQRCFISFFLETTTRLQPVNITNCFFFQSVEIEIVPGNSKNSNEIVISMMTQNEKKSLHPFKTLFVWCSKKSVLDNIEIPFLSYSHQFIYCSLSDSLSDGSSYNYQICHFDTYSNRFLS